MAPYRDAPHPLLCPRCGEILEDVFDRVLACVRCGGVWLPQPTIDAAFGSPRWPHGSSAWWRIELECPECAAGGDVTALVPYVADNVVIDRCTGHGVWLDAGELGRLTDRSEIDELAALYRLLHPTAPVPRGLAARRALSDDERAQRSREAEVERARIFDERRRRDADGTELDRREQAERSARARMEAPPPARVAKAEPRPEVAPAEDPAVQLGRLAARRAVAAANVSRLEYDLEELRDRVANTRRALDSARAEVAAIDREVAAVARR